MYNFNYAFNFINRLCELISMIYLLISPSKNVYEIALHLLSCPVHQLIVDHLLGKMILFLKIMKINLIKRLAIRSRVQNMFFP